MNCLTQPESAAWLAARQFGDFSVSCDPETELSRRRCGEFFAVEASETYCIASAVTQWVQETVPEFTLVTVVESGIWPSSENLGLNYCWRRSLGVSTLLREAPGHLFMPFERHEMLSLIQMALIFGWGISVVPSDGYTAFSVDHDGHAIGYASSGDAIERLSAALDLERPDFRV